MTTVTTDSIESKTKVKGNFEVFDLFFMLGYIGVSYVAMGMVHEKMHIPFMIFSFVMAGFLTMRSNFNKKRRNYESLYFLLTKDISVYKPFRVNGERTNEN